MCYLKRKVKWLSNHMGVYKERVQYKEVFCYNICASEYFALQY